MDPPTYPFEETSFMNGPLLKWFDRFLKKLTVIASDTSTKTSDPSAWCKIRYGVGFDSLTESIVPTNIEVNPLPLLPLRRCKKYKKNQ